MKRFRKLAWTLSLLSATSLGGLGNAIAASCPDPVIKMIVANPAGGSGDLVARVTGEKAGAILGQPYVIENRPGASTEIGTSIVAKSKPDGCTILSLTSSGVIVSVLRNLPYDLHRDFVPMLGIGSFPLVLTVPAASKINSIADIRAAAKSPEGITYTSGGPGTMGHLSAARLVKDLGGTGTHVPYKGNSEAIQALLGNHVQLFFPSPAEVIPLVKSGKIRLLAITSGTRSPLLPDVPTMKELGFADFDPRIWFAFLAPAGTPADVVSQQRDALVKAMADPSVQERLGAAGFATEIKNASELTAFMKSEAVRWGKVIKDNNIKSE